MIEKTYETPSGIIHYWTNDAVESSQSALIFLPGLTAEAIYRIYPWKSLLKSGPKSVSTTDYGRKLMYDMMMVYDGDQKRYARLAGYGYKIFSEAVEKKLSYEVKCPQLVICGKEDCAGSCIRYLKAYEKNTGKSVQWIDKAGHNSNTDQPDIVNRLIDEFLNNKIKEKLG